MPSESIIQVALPVPLPGCFDYRLPAGSPTPPRGARVQVPFGRRTLVGLVHGHQPSQFAKLKNVQRVLDQEASSIRASFGEWRHAHSQALVKRALDARSTGSRGSWIRFLDSLSTGTRNVLGRARSFMGERR